MPTFEFSTPGGKTYEFDAPDQQAALNAFNSVYQPPAPEKRGYLESFVRPLARAAPVVGGATQQTAREGLDLMQSGLQQFTESAGHPTDIAGPGKMALGALGYVTAPLTGPFRALLQEPAADVGRQGLEAAGVPPQYAEPIAQVVADTATGLAGMKIPRPRPPIPPPPKGFRIGDVPVSRGEFTGDPEQLRFEREARLGVHGPAAAENVRQFDVARAPAVARAGETTIEGLSPTGEVLAESPREGAAIAQRGAQEAQVATKAALDADYAAARAQSGAARGAIDLLGFRDMGRSIHEELFNGIGVEQPVLVDRNLTPEASRMVDDLNMQPRDLLRRLRVEIPQPTPAAADLPRAVGAYEGAMPELAGVDLTMVDQMRKWLGKLRATAFKSGDRERMRAAAAVLDKFDERIDSAVDTGLFRLPDGSQADPRVLQAWRDARAAHADYKATFFKGGHGDPVGRAMEQIIGRHGSETAIPDAVADFMYGSRGFDASTKNVQLMERMRAVLTPRQWAAAKQGLYSRLVEPPGTVEGATQWTHAKVANNLQRFLDSDMARVLTGPERDMVRSYADLRSRLGAAEASPRLPVQAQRMVDRLGMYAAGHVGAALGHSTTILGMGTIGRYAAEFGVRGLKPARAARRVKRDMVIIGHAWDDYAKAVIKFETGRSARDIARLTVATRNLEHALRDIGTSIQALSGPETAPAQQQQ